MTTDPRHHDDDDDEGANPRDEACPRRAADPLHHRTHHASAPSRTCDAPLAGELETLENRSGCSRRATSRTWSVEATVGHASSFKLIEPSRFSKPTPSFNQY